MSEKAEVLIKKLLDELRMSKGGELTLPLRKLLWGAITSGQAEDAKRITLTKLDAICVAHGSSIWSKKFGNADELTVVLGVAIDAARGALAEEDALNIRDDFYVSVVEDQEYAPHEYPAMFVGHAAANTIVTATDDFIFDPTDLRNDGDLEPDAFEPSYLVASAFAEGLWDEGDTEQRRKFWEWYLSVAVPEVLS